MSMHHFALIASGPDPDADDFEERFLRAGCDDATISVHKGALLLSFTREARCLSRALLGAVRDVQSAGARVLHVEPDHLVNLADIASRSNLGRAAVTAFMRGEQGKIFPVPIARVCSDSPLWDWVVVARWLYGNRPALGKGVSLRDVVTARVMRQANLALAAPAGQERVLSRRTARIRRIDRLV